MRQQRRTVPFVKWISGTCTNCGGHCSINAITHTPHQPHYCSDCRNMMKDTSDDQE